MNRKVKGFRTTDGAGVSLVRVLGNQTVKEFDPILMLDSFDSTNQMITQRVFLFIHTEE
ncbi:redox-sensitive bicupin YhaK (pirin superfamily) [Peptoniphilus olsenii]|uniref:Redox-sensitive bicupin YhaK (Pirin superfamily) n=1 Tax=Peptoniphilus olsenii TaxID=411570 RepID=A0ABV2JBG3_9FIRM